MSMKLLGYHFCDARIFQDVAGNLPGDKRAWCSLYQASIHGNQAGWEAHRSLDELLIVLAGAHSDHAGAGGGTSPGGADHRLGSQKGGGHGHLHDGKLTQKALRRVKCKVNVIPSNCTVYKRATTAPNPSSGSELTGEHISKTSGEIPKSFFVAVRKSPLCTES